MRNAEQKLTARLQAQVSALKNTSTAGVFRLNLNSQGRLEDLRHPDNWLVIDPRIIGLPAKANPDLRQVIAVFDQHQDNFIPEVNNIIAVNNPKYVRTASFPGPAGDLCWLELKIVVERDAGGHPIALNGCVLDQSREHNVETGLRDPGEFLNEILLEVPVAIFRLDITDEHSEIVDYASISGNWMINASALYGLPKGTLRSPLDTLTYIHPEDRRAVSDKFNEAREKNLSRYEAREPVDILGKTCVVSASLGISLFPTDGEDGETLLKNADTALYLAKGKGRNNCQFYDPEDAARSLAERRCLDGAY